VLDLATRALQSGSRLNGKSWNMAREAARRETEMLGGYGDPRIRRAVLQSLDEIIAQHLEGKRIRVSDVADIAVGKVKDHKKLERWFSNEPFNKKRLRRSTRKARK